MARSKNGGTFCPWDSIVLHPNDFAWAWHLDNLTEDDRSVYQEYVKCFQHTPDCGVPTDRACVTASPNAWQQHYIRSKRHFPLKNYIAHAFPLLRRALESCDEVKCIFECGCGTGSSLIPLLMQCTNKHAIFYGCDISSAALDHFSSNETAKDFLLSRRLKLFEYGSKWMCQEDSVSCVEASGSKRAREAGLSADERCVSVGQQRNELMIHITQKIDIVLLVFVISSFPSVTSMIVALREIRACMSEAGVILFRDYGVLDHNFFRFSKNSRDGVNSIFFRKTDGTTQCFFSLETARDVFKRAGFEAVDHDESRLQYHCTRVVNRKNGKEMCKVFLNGVFRLDGSP